MHIPHILGTQMSNSEAFLIIHDSPEFVLCIRMR